MTTTVMLSGGMAMDEEAFEEALLCASQCGCGEAVTDVGDGVDDGVSVEDSGVVGPFSAKLCCFT